MNKKRGSVLILTMWVLFLLALLTLGLKTHVDARVRASGILKHQVHGRYLARAGASMATRILRADTNHWDGLGEPWTEEGVHREEVGVTRWLIEDEESRLNLNRTGPVIMTRFFRDVGGLSELEAESVVASIIDWRDEDDEARPGGAESGFYESRPAGYPARNGSFASIHELLLVKGVDNGLFSRIRSNITVHGAGHINVNTASREVLLALARTVEGPGEQGAGSLVEKILDVREQNEVFKAIVWSDIAARLSLSEVETLIFRRMSDHLTVRSSYFTGFCEADIGDDGRVEHQVRFTLHRESGQVVGWYEE